MVKHSTSDLFVERYRMRFGRGLSRAVILASFTPALLLSTAAGAVDVPKVSVPVPHVTVVTPRLSAGTKDPSGNK
jgi:hypothetical protein